MTQINLSRNQKQTHKHTNQTCGCQGEGGVGDNSTGGFVLANSVYRTDKQPSAMV